MRRFDAAIVSMVVAILIAGLAVISWQTVRGAEEVLLPALDRKAGSVARSIAGLASDAVRYGIPVDRLVRADEVLQAALDENPDFAFASILDANGSVVAEAALSAYGGYGAGEGEGVNIVSWPIEADGAVRGEVVIATPVAVAENLVRDLWIDVGILLLVALLVALELTAFAFTLPSAQLLRGLTQRLDALRRGDVRPHPVVAGGGAIGAEVAAVDAQIARLRANHSTLAEAAREKRDEAAHTTLARLAATHRLQDARDAPPASLAAVRTPVFLFFFAEEMTRPFLPTYIAHFAQPVAGLSVELVIALPMVIFMAIVALSQPWLNGWTEGFGRARSLRTGALIACLGFLGTGYVGNMAELILCRTLTAAGFAMVFVAAQGYIVDRTDTRQRARGIGLFVSAIMAAMLCGPPIGGIVADRLGDSMAFTVSAVMALVAFVCALAALPGDRRHDGPMPRGVRLRDVAAVLGRPVMAALLVGCALPAKMLLIGLCFYFLPLTLASQFEPAVIGRVLMLYGLAMLIVVPVVSRWSDEASLRMPFVVLGGIASALAVLHLSLWPEPWGAALMVLQIGIAQGISTTPQSALVGEIGRRILPDLSEGGIYGVFRLVERLGTALGPLFVGAVWGFASPEVAALATGGLVAAGALSFLIAWYCAPMGAAAATAAAPGGRT